MGGTDASRCRMMCMIAAAILALIVFFFVIDIWWLIDLIIAAAIGYGVWWLLTSFACQSADETSGAADTTPPIAPTPKAASPAASAAPVAAAAPAPEAPASPEPAPAAEAASAPASGNWTDRVAADSGKASASRGQSGLVASAALSEEDTLRSGVGGWVYNTEKRPFRPGDAPASDAAASAPVEEAPATADAAANWTDGVSADSGKASTTRGQTGLGASAALSEEAGLRDGVGSWKYEATGAAGEDFDGDGVIEGADEGEKPSTLDGPRDGGADDLKKIKGVGPKMEAMLNEMGFYHFDQVANWTDQEVAWVDANLEGFKGRVSRDNWVDQARVLASGEETEFSKKVDKGDVY